MRGFLFSNFLSVPFDTSQNKFGTFNNRIHRYQGFKKIIIIMKIFIMGK